MCLLVKNSKEPLLFCSLYVALGTLAFVLPKVPSHYQTKLANKIPQGIKEGFLCCFFFFSWDRSSAEPEHHRLQPAFCTAQNRQHTRGVWMGESDAAVFLLLCFSARIINRVEVRSSGSSEKLDI